MGRPKKDVGTDAPQDDDVAIEIVVTAEPLRDALAKALRDAEKTGEYAMSAEIDALIQCVHTTKQRCASSAAMLDGDLAASVMALHDSL